MRQPVEKKQPGGMLGWDGVKLTCNGWNLLTLGIIGPFSVSCQDFRAGENYLVVCIADTYRI